MAEQGLVARLRACAAVANDLGQQGVRDQFSEAADAIERLEAQTIEGRDLALQEAEAEVARLEQERDEARLEVEKLKASQAVLADHATELSEERDEARRVLAALGGH